MQIPLEAANWVAAMRQSAKGQQIVQNLAADTCVSANVAALFWSKIGAAAMGEPQRVANDVCNRDAASLLCSGPLIADSSFDVVCHVVPFRALRHMCRDFLDKHAIEESLLTDPAKEADAYRKLIAAGAVTGFLVSSAAFKKIVDVVFLTPEYRSGNIAELPQRLAFSKPGATPRGLFVLFRIDRSRLPGSLHRPTALDGIDQENFRPVADCDSAHGMTAPGGAPALGVPEAVTRGFDLTDVGYSAFIVP